MKDSTVANIDTLDLTRPLEVIALAVKERAVRCRLLGGRGEIILRAQGIWDMVPGEILTVIPRKAWSFGRFPYLSGAIQSTRLDIGALGLEPLGLEDRGQWDPEEEYWYEEGESPEAWQEEIMALGPRPLFEMERVLPGEDPMDFHTDPILESLDRRDAGDRQGAEEILMAELEADLRALDAHAHLGHLWFEGFPEKAIRHYEVGVRIGELSLGEDFDGVLTWGLIDNRPFFRCIHGYGLCLWRLGRFDAAVAVFERMLRLNPADNQGIRFLMDPVRAEQPWGEESAMNMHTLAEMPPWDWPADANDEILAVLRNRETSTSERLLAVELAGDLGVLNDVLAEELLRILDDSGEEETLRAQAATSLGPALEEAEIGGFEDPDILAVTEEVLQRARVSLRDLYRDSNNPDQVRRRALEASTRAPEPWHPGAVRAAYHDPAREWKLTAVFCMRFVSGFDAEIVETLAADDMDLLYEAVWAAGDQEVEDAWPYLRQLVLTAAAGIPILPDDAHGEKFLLLAAIDAVANIRPSEAPEVLSVIADSEDEELSEAALDALEMIEGLWMLDDDEESEGETTWH